METMKSIKIYNESEQAELDALAAQVAGLKELLDPICEKAAALRDRVEKLRVRANDDYNRGVFVDSEDLPAEYHPHIALESARNQLDDVFSVNGLEEALSALMRAGAKVRS